MAPIKLVDIAVRNQLAKLEVIVQLCSFALRYGFWRQVKIQVLWVLAEAHLEVIEVHALCIQERELAEVMCQVEVFGRFWRRRNQFLDLPLLLLRCHENRAWDFMKFDLSNDLTSFLRVHSIGQILICVIRESLAVLIDSLPLQSIDRVIDLLCVSCANNEVKH